MIRILIRLRELLANLVRSKFRGANDRVIIWIFRVIIWIIRATKWRPTKLDEFDFKNFNSGSENDL